MELLKPAAEDRLRMWPVFAAREPDRLRRYTALIAEIAT
jgi:hypothetical protein